MSLITPELREALRDFAIKARECTVSDITDMQFARFRYHKGTAFEVSDAVIESQREFIRRAIKKLGPDRGHGKVLAKALWDFAAAESDEHRINDRAVLDEALKQIEETSASICEFFRPCPLVRLPSDVERIEIGRVIIEKSESKVKELEKNKNNLRFIIGDDWGIGLNFEGEDVKCFASIPKTMWAIKLSAADPLREEEALWLVDISLTLLRLSVKRPDLGLLAPSLGDNEPHPFLLPDRSDHSLAILPNGTAEMGGLSTPNVYEITSEGGRAIHEPLTQRKIAMIFEPRAGSIAERFAQGCGWLTRGRRSKDRSDRLLYFFTAIEALLSDSDRSAPVVQTIARHSATLLSDEHEKREAIARDVKNLYGIRSALVHAGKRGAYDIDCNSAQLITELLYARIWSDIDLSISHRTLLDELGRASYGSELRVPLRE
ncbi:conserved hypothetical protein [Altererythrobacter sp. B11]|uniref:HEPN domain-containing protein n=1 Tax=Altererythrobacter sp. B11 TaxID=2060312 RepID=UPI000DC6F2ED|nr:HEPN domain-containing protein [Altererythrobacter sp. B11]BBC74350.1 conserved hypothetical protein [Altererythrobacter sp. B11]